MITKKRIALAFIIFLAIAGVLLLIWCKYGEDLAKFIGSLIVGLFLFCQVIVSGTRATAAEKTAEEMQKATELTEKGHIHERFKNAIEHLGDESASTRLGGIYALHNLARDVDSYREQVFEILCAHIREKTTRQEYEQRVLSDGRNEPSIEIQSILNILFRRRQDRKIYTKFEANLEDSNLEGADLSYASLKKANLGGANLRDSDFWFANLKDAILEQSDLYDAALIQANLDKCSFSDANLHNAILDQAKNLKANQLFTVKTLYQVSLEPDIREEIEKRHLILFLSPASQEY